jgi:hypothetical protein
MRVKLRHKNIHIPAISDEVLPQLLVRLKVYDDIVSGKMKCRICGRKLTLDTIGAIGMLNGDLILVCDKLSCISKASILFSEFQTSG